MIQLNQYLAPFSLNHACKSLFYMVLCLLTHFVVTFPVIVMGVNSAYRFSCQYSDLVKLKVLVSN
jgi:hypothetical protein